MREKYFCPRCMKPAFGCTKSQNAPGVCRLWNEHSHVDTQVEYILGLLYVAAAQHRLQLFSNITAPFLQLFSNISASFLQLFSNITAPLLQLFSNITAPFLQLFSLKRPKTPARAIVMHGGLLAVGRAGIIARRCS